MPTHLRNKDAHFLLRHSQMPGPEGAPDSSAQAAVGGAFTCMIAAASCLQSDLSSRFWWPKYLGSLIVLAIVLM